MNINYKENFTDLGYVKSKARLLLKEEGLNFSSSLALVVLWLL